jgi:hypothetical protein
MLKRYGAQLWVVFAGPWVACHECVVTCAGYDFAQAGAVGELLRYLLLE